MRSLVIVSGLLLLAACRDKEASSAREYGGPGTIDGKFVTPRAIAFDVPRDLLYVIDKTGRIQKFSADGTWLRTWRTPSVENGRPTGLTVDRRGNVWVADTHYHRVLQYSSEGELLLQFGREGRGLGEFIYVGGILVDEDGTIYVSEFGGNDRIQVFDPSGRFLRAWGSFGEGPDQFRRPQAMLLGPEGALYIADAINHRVVVCDRTGRRLREFGSYGDGPGELKYPFGLAWGRDGALLVAEQGNHRVQRFTVDGRSIGFRGSAGAGPGELSSPWSLSVDKAGTVYVCDTGNHRIQVWTQPETFKMGRGP